MKLHNKLLKHSLSPKSSNLTTNHFCRSLWNRLQGQGQANRHHSGPQDHEVHLDGGRGPDGHPEGDLVAEAA